MQTSVPVKIRVVFSKNRDSKASTNKETQSMISILLNKIYSSFCLLFWQVCLKWYLNVSIFLYTSWHTSHFIISLGAWMVLRCRTTTCLRWLDLPHETQIHASPSFLKNCSISSISAWALLSKISGGWGTGADSGSWRNEFGRGSPEKLQVWDF